MAKLPVGVSLAANKETVILGGIAAGLILYFFWQGKKAVAAVGDTVASVAKPLINAANPASQTNIVQTLGTAAYRVVNPKAVSQDLTLSTALLDGLDTLGGWVTGKGTYDPNK